MKQRINKGNLANLIIIIPFLIITAFFSIMCFIYPEQSKSETEFRFLAQRPALSYENIGSFPQDFEKYYNDQFPYRENFLKMYSRIQLASGKISVRDLYVSEGFLLPKEYLYSQKDISASAKKTNALMNFVRTTGKKCGYIALPYKTSVYSYLLPAYLQNDIGKLNYEQFKSQLSPDIKTCDAFNCYAGQSSSNLEEYFFRTDIHWNAKGAGVAFKYILRWLFDEKFIGKAIGTDLTLDYTYVENSNYLGDLNRRFSFLFPANEQIPVLKDTDKSIKYYLSCDSSEYTLDRRVLTDQTLAQGIKSYNSVYSNNLSYYKMVNDHSLLSTKVLILKDSMQNAMTDMFAHVFNITEVVDIRSLKDAELHKIIANSKADLVLLMYHQNNVTGDMFNFGIE